MSLRSIQSPYFITATGTGIGKTFVTSALAWQLRAQGKNVKAIKPIISGFDPSQMIESDAGQLLQAQGLHVTAPLLDIISPWRFAASLSPDMAAAAENKAIDLESLVRFCKQPETDYFLVEGIGGVMTPLNANHTVLDWMSALSYPVILAAGSYLGTLTHTLTAAHTIISRGLRLHAVILNESTQDSVSLFDLQQTLQRFVPQETTIQSISRLDYSLHLWKYAPNLLSIMTCSKT